MIIRNAELNYYKNLLNNLKNNARKLWSHINSLTETKNNTNIAVTPGDMNDFFTSIFKQAPIYNNKHPHSLANDSYIRTNLFPVTNNEIISTFSSLTNLLSVGNDRVRPDIIKSIASLISPHLTYILNLSFSQGICPKPLKTAIVVPIHKTGTYNDPNNNRPILILTIFSKLIEKLFYNGLSSFIYKNNILHNNQFGFVKNKSTNTAIAHILA